MLTDLVQSEYHNYLSKRLTLDTPLSKSKDSRHVLEYVIDQPPEINILNNTQ
jgi:hypothetical protein